MSAKGGGRNRAAAPSLIVLMSFRLVNEALELWRKLGDVNWQGYCLTNIARSYKARVQLADPLSNSRQDYLEQSLKSFDEAVACLNKPGMHRAKPSP